MSAVPYRVYALFDARVPQQMRYVGRTQNLASRMYIHRSRKNKPVSDWARQVREAGSVVSCVVLQECLDEAEATTAESLWISRLSGLLNINSQSRHLRGIPKSPSPLSANLTPDMRTYFSSLGSRGGKAGTKADKRKAALARWAKEKSRAAQ